MFCARRHSGPMPLGLVSREWAAVITFVSACGAGQGASAAPSNRAPSAAKACQAVTKFCCGEVSAMSSAGVRCRRRLHPVYGRAWRSTGATPQSARCAQTDSRLRSHRGRRGHSASVLRDFLAQPYPAKWYLCARGRGHARPSTFSLFCWHAVCIWLCFTRWPIFIYWIRSMGAELFLTACLLDWFKNASLVARCVCLLVQTS